MRTNRSLLGPGDGWRQIAGELKHVSASSDGAVWGVNSKDEVFRWTGRFLCSCPQWDPETDFSRELEEYLGSQCAEPDLYLGGRWLATGRGRAEVCIGERRWSRLGESIARMRSLGGQAMPLRLSQMGPWKQISVGNSKNIWGVNANIQIFNWTGRWLATGRGRAEVCIGERRWSGLGSHGKDEVFSWTGNSFTPVPNGTLKQISVGNTKGGHAAKARAK